MSTQTPGATLAVAGKARPVHLSASAIRAFLHCPNCFRLAYLEGVRPDVDNESQRMGTNWHALHEVYRNCITACGDKDVAFESAIGVLNAAYATVPDSVTDEDWELERTILASSFAGSVWYHQNDDLETITTELPFRLPVHHPLTGLPLPMDEVLRVGKIDRFVRHETRVRVADYKSTSKSLDDDSEFWDHLRLDSQMSMYVMAGREMAAAGLLVEYGITPEDADQIDGLYDVWRKPTIRPAKINQGETAAFLSSGDYMGEKFQVAVTLHPDPSAENKHLVSVNGKPAEVEMGKKGFAIRETVAMYGARLLADIYERPEFYFARRPIPRTALDIKYFRREVYSIWQCIKAMRAGNWWYRNDQQDNMLMHGDLGPICYHTDKTQDVLDGNTPAGFKRLWGQKETAA